VNKNSKTIIKDLADLYLKLYKNKELYAKHYFKHTPEDVEKTLLDVLGRSSYLQETPSKNEKEPIRAEILQLESINEISNYLNTCLKYDKSASDSKEQVLNGISLKELKHLYFVIYNYEAKSSMRKVDLFNSIEKYFASIARVATMKP